jgi:predicted dehydrogenase
VLKKRKKIIIIGFGIAGRRYFEILKKKNFDILIVRRSNNKIYYKGKDISLSKNNLKKILLSQIDAVIIASPAKTHWYYLKIFLKKKLSIVVEKPVIDNANQFRKLKKLISGFKNNFYINHSDLYSKHLKQLIKNCKFKNIKKIKINYGNNNKKYYASEKILPLLNWLPHILAILIFFLKEIDSYNIIFYKKVVKKGLIFEKSLIEFYTKKTKSEFYFSNFPKSNSRKFRLDYQKGYLVFDSYKNKSFLNHGSRTSKSIYSSTKSFDYLVEIILKNIGKSNNNDFPLYEKYFYIQQKLIKDLLSRKNFKASN